MSSLFRSAKAVRIARAILNCDEDERKQLLEQLKKDSGQTSMITLLTNTCKPIDILDAFMKSKKYLNDQLLNHLIAFIHKNMNMNGHDSKDDTEFSQLEELPQDVFNTMGSYLPLESSIKLSLTNSTIYTMVQNDEYFSQCRKQTKTLILTPKLGKIMIETNANMECYKKCSKLYISSLVDKEYLSASQSVKCQPLLGTSCFFHQIAMFLRTEKINMFEYNYDLHWFKVLLSNVKEIYWSEKWGCIFRENHIPMSWIFDINIKDPRPPGGADGADGDDNNHDGYSHITNANNVNGVKITGCATSGDFEKPSTITTSQTMIFVNAYDEYFKDKIASIKLKDESENDKKKDDNDDCNSGEKKFADADKEDKKEKETRMEKMRIANATTRKLKDMKIDVNRFERDVLSKLHSNYGELTFCLPPRQYWAPFDSLEKFYQVFHSQLTSLHIRCQTVHNYDLNIVSQLFGGAGRLYIGSNSNPTFDVFDIARRRIQLPNCRNTLKLIDDLNKPEGELALKKLLKKHHFKINVKIVPQIRHLKISMGHDYGLYLNRGRVTVDMHRESSVKKGIISFFKHNKLIRLFNFSKSVTHIDLSIALSSNTVQIKYMLSDVMGLIKILSKTMKRLKLIEILLKPKPVCEWQQFCLLYELYIDEILLNCCLLPKIKTLNIICKCTKHLQRNSIKNKWNIVLDSVDMLLPKNALKLKQLIKNQTKQSRSTMETQWNELKQEIKFGKCLVKHSFVFTKTFRV